MTYYEAYDLRVNYVHRDDFEKTYPLEELSSYHEIAREVLPVLRLFCCCRVVGMNDLLVKKGMMVVALETLPFLTVGGHRLVCHSALSLIQRFVVRVVSGRDGGIGVRHTRLL